MTFHSILFPGVSNPLTLEAPDFFPDLNLDQMVEAITASKHEYDLKPFFYTPLHDVEAIRYRHTVMQDLEQAALFEIIGAFASQMREVRKHLTQADKLHYNYQQESWFLDAIALYGEAVMGLAQGLAEVEVRSRGLLAFREYLARYAQSDRFTSLVAEAHQVRADLSSVHYCLLIQDNRVRVRRYESEIDYSVEVERTFEKFKQGVVKDYRIEFLSDVNMNHVEARVLELVARLYPSIFAGLDRFCAAHADFLDETVGRFDREIQFYLAYLEYIAVVKRAGLPFCYPDISTTSKAVSSEEGFDLALAYKLTRNSSPVVCNDFYLAGPERIFIVSGPNQGGKTTFARAFGQLHYLASLGCPVPGKRARLFLFDRLFTHFEKEEDIRNLRGKLQDDLVRIHAILSQATSHSMVIMNEIFTSTTLHDAVFLSRQIMDRIMQLDLLCVYVTFIVELAELSDQTVSMVSTVVPDNPALRTYRIVRKPADGLSYALSIAEKHRLTYDRLKERLTS